VYSWLYLSRDGPVNRILLATANPAKLDRLRWLVDGLGFETILPTDLGLPTMPVVTEDRVVFSDNAAQKAETWSAAAGGCLTLASDGGLEVPALGRSWDALRTRRNAGKYADDQTRIAHLLRLMRRLHGSGRNTVWHEAIAIAERGGVLRTWSASGDGGRIVETHVPGTGDTAFWTESIRYYPAVGKLYRDLSPAQREKLDSAWTTLREQVRAYFQSSAGSASTIEHK
jgi:inosine/xanthosine triphosphate pyrophosphatase family protein